MTAETQQQSGSSVELVERYYGDIVRDLPSLEIDGQAISFSVHVVENQPLSLDIVGTVFLRPGTSCCQCYRVALCRFEGVPGPVFAWVLGLVREAIRGRLLMQMREKGL